MVNFRGHQNLTVNFSDETTISGDNRLGKSTVFDAFVWLLFGKDQFDRKDHEIIPIIDGKRIERVDSEVTAVLDVDGLEMILKRILHQKWVRRRGTAEEVYDGCDTLCWVNNVPKKVSEYTAIIDMIIDESVFKLITNPSYFLFSKKMGWEKQREFLFQIAGTISDVEIAQKSPAFAQLLELISGKSFAEFKKELSVRKKKLQEQLESINPKIDQTARLMPQQRDFAPVEVEIKIIDGQIAEIDDKLLDRAKVIRAQYDLIQQTQRQINDAKLAQQNIINAKRTEYADIAFKANQIRIDAQNVLLSSKKRLNEALSRNDEACRLNNELTGKITAKEAEISKLRAEWETENAKEYTTKAGCLVCPVFGHDCGDSTAASKHIEAQGKAKQSFIDAQEKKLSDITANGKKLTIDLEQLKIKLKDVEKEIGDNVKYIEICKADVAQREEEANIPAVEPAQVIPTEIPEWVELEAKIKDLESSMSTEPAQDNSDLTNKKKDLGIKRDDLKRTLTERDSIIHFTAEIERLKKESADYSQQIADIEKQEYTMSEFNKVKIDECERRINSLFQIVKFQLFDKTIDGNEFECCIPLNKAGVPISATNTAEKINAGLDIIATLSNFYNVSAPIFVDSAESVNNIFNPGAQLVALRVTKESVLTVTNN